jgi:quercetin 2,3-dioxygenase
MPAVTVPGALELPLVEASAPGEPVYNHEPSVMNSRTEILRAFEDVRAGNLGTVPADHIGNA